MKPAPGRSGCGNHDALLRWIGIVAAVPLLATAASASAEDGELRLYGEPHSYTDVADAADGEDPFDANVAVLFERSLAFGRVQRESASSDGREAFVDIADHERVVNRLVVKVDIGLYRDLALYGRLPILLSDDRELTLPNGSSAAEVETRLSETDTDNTVQPLFGVPFGSPTRSGLDHLALGLAWSVTNQRRDPAMPTWVLMAEGRFPVGGVLSPCNGDDCVAGGGPGSSQGLFAVRLETRVSRRLRLVEPYAGFAYDLRLPGTSKDLFEPGGSLPGYVSRIPPMVGEATAGVAWIPWEQRGRNQRLVVDLRATAAYVSRGRDFSPLFDALGTSPMDVVSRSVPECSNAGLCPRETEFTGLTDVDAHGRFGGQLAVELQAARYVRFRVGGRVLYDTPFLITGANACNGGASVDASDPRRAGCSSGIVNPHHRAVIDLSGNRFRLDGQTTIDLFAEVRGQF